MPNHVSLIHPRHESIVWCIDPNMAIWIMDHMAVIKEFHAFRRAVLF